MHLQGALQAGGADRNDAAPVHRTEGARRSGTQRQGAHGWTDAIGPHHEIVSSSRAVRECNRDAPIVLRNGCNGDAEPARHVSDPVFKRAVQHWSYDTDARTNLRPDGSEIGVRKQASLRIVEL